MCRTWEHGMSLEGWQGLTPWDFQHCCPASLKQIHKTQQGHIQKCPSLPSLRRHSWSLSLAFQSWLSLNITKKQKERSPVTWRRKKPPWILFYGMSCPSMGRKGLEGHLHMTSWTLPASSMLASRRLYYTSCGTKRNQIPWKNLEGQEGDLL